MINTFLVNVSGDRRSDNGLIDRSVQRLMKDEMGSKQAGSEFFKQSKLSKLNKLLITNQTQNKDFKAATNYFFIEKCMFDLCAVFKMPKHTCRGFFKTKILGGVFIRNSNLISI